MQANCLAGVWAYHANRARHIIEAGDVEEALGVASAIGDDRLQKQALHPDDAGKFSGEIRKNMPLGRERFLAARKVLLENRFTDPERIGAVGYCFGGSVVLQMARDGLDVITSYSIHYTKLYELMDLTRGSRKSHSRSGSTKGARKPPLAAST